LGLRAGRQEDNERHLLRRPASIRDGAFWIQRPSTSGARGGSRREGRLWLSQCAQTVSQFLEGGRHPSPAEI